MIVVVEPHWHSGGRDADPAPGPVRL